MEKKRGKMNKKGAEMTIGTIIVIILAIVVLVVIIYGFTQGWGNLWQKIIGIGGGKPNIATHVTSCQLACSISSKVDYCKDRNVTLNDGKTTLPMKCPQIAQNPEYGLDQCPAIDCNEVNTGAGTCGGFKGVWQKTACSLTQVTIDLGTITNAYDKADNIACCKKTCASVGGTWSNTACGSGLRNVYETLTDKDEGKNPDQTTATNCCLAA